MRSGPPIAWDSRVIMLLGGKSFPLLYNLTKVEKKNVLSDTYMASTAFTGGYQVAVYLDPSEENHSKLKRFLFEVLKNG